MALSLKTAHLSRYKDIARLFFKYGRGDLIKGAEFGKEVHNGHGRPVETPQAADLARDLEAMGPVFIKIRQLLSTRPDILPLAYVEALARLQDHVEALNFGEVEKIISRELSMRMAGDHFLSIGGGGWAAAGDSRPVL